jgi:catechol-2,3-dioxygenase
LINAHALFAASACSSIKTKTARPGLITALDLLTNVPLNEMKAFYGGLLGLPVTGQENELTVIAGESVIRFTGIKEKTTRPFYHVAFNIPENKIQKAYAWQRKRTPIIHPNTEGTRNEVVHFAHWNAHSVFFLDPAGNLLEYIARHDLENAADGDFTVKDILYASEIGLIVDDVISSGNVLQKELDLTQYREASAGFWPIGDESGLLLMIRKGREWSAHPGQSNKTGIFKTAVTIRNEGKRTWELPGYPYSIIAAG